MGADVRGKVGEKNTTTNSRCVRGTDARTVSVDDVTGRIGLEVCVDLRYGEKGILVQHAQLR